MITVVTEPSGKPSVQDALWHIVSSDESGTAGMQYVFDVYVNGDQKVRVKRLPDPETANGNFDAGPVVRQYITYDWFRPENKIYLRSPYPSGEIAIDYTVEYGEDVSGVITTGMASGEVTAYNFRPPLFKRRVNDFTAKDNKFITNRPLYANCSLDSGEMLLLGVHSPTGVSAVINKYNYSNQLIAGNNTTTALQFDEYCQLNISPAGINGELGSGFIDATVKYYDVVIDELSISFRVNVICDREFTPVPLHFMNEYGMFDTARFALVSRLTMDVERKAFKQREYSFGASSVDYFDTYGVYRESKINYAQRSDWSYKLNMDAPTDAEYEWLAELVNSPLIYAEIDGYFYPVTIKNTNYEYSKNVFNGLKVLEIDIELNQTRYSHAR